MNIQASRRDLLKAAGALVVAIGAPVEAFAAAAPAAQTLGNPAARYIPKPVDPTQLDSWLAVDKSGKVIAYFGKGDVGQGVDVAVAQIVADELDVPLDHVQVVLADTALTCDQGGVAGSMGISKGAPNLRNAAAEARRLLLERAAAKWKVPVETLTVDNGVILAPGGRKLPYGQVVGEFDAKLEWNGLLRSAMEVKGKAKPKSPDQYKLVGTSPKRRDVAAKVFGQFTYAADHRLPGMLHARVIRPPVAGAKPVQVDEASIAQIPDTQLVRKGDFLAVVSKREWDAVRASRALKITWSDAKPPFVDSEHLFDYIRTVPAAASKVAKNSGDVDKAFAAAEQGGAKLVEAEYQWPFQSHASLGPGCALADARPEGVTVWSPSQKTHAGANGIAKLLGRQPSEIRIIYTPGPGSYGRNDGADAGADAALISQMIGAPVRVQGMRPDGLGWDPKAPASIHKVKAAIGPDGKMVAYDYLSRGFNRQDVSAFENDPFDLLAGFETGFSHKVDLVYDAPEDGYVVPNYRSAWDVVPAMLVGPSPLRTSNLRDPLGTQIHFASECFTDECALAAGADPVAFRLAHIKDPRHRAVIEAAAKAADWQPGPPGSRRSQEGEKLIGRGFAYGLRGATVVGLAVEVEVDKATGRVWPRHFWVAHDCGLIVNPETLKHVIEGNIVFASSRVLFEETRFDTKNVTSVNWSSYPILEMPDAPATVEIVLINRPEMAPSGAGEPASRPVAPAIANAIFDATGVRLRRAPFTPQRVKAALQTA